VYNITLIVVPVRGVNSVAIEVLQWAIGRNNRNVLMGACCRIQLEKKEKKRGTIKSSILYKKNMLPMGLGRLTKEYPAKPPTAALPMNSLLALVM